MTYETMDKIAPAKPYSALIFDCDGTLADTMPGHFAAWVAALRAGGGDITEERFYQNAGVTSAAIIEALNRDFGYALDIPATVEAKEKMYVEGLHEIVEISAVADIARAHAGKVPMAVASGGLRSVVHATLDAIGLRPLFDAVVTAEDVVHGKPAPDIFLRAAELLGVAPEDCIVYEDGDPGIVAARAAGMRVIDVRVLWAS
jgi:beta-phosphoglucomutase-like phosphatase (HAD superfamily)